MLNNLFQSIQVHHSEEIFMLQRRFEDDFGENIWKTDELIRSFNDKILEGDVFIPQRTICGFCIFKIITDYIEIYSIFVKPSYRKKGVAKKFISNCVDYCKRNKLRKIILDVSEENLKAINFYRKHEFIFCGRRKGYYKKNGSYKDSFTMHRLI